MTLLIWTIWVVGMLAFITGPVDSVPCNLTTLPRGTGEVCSAQLDCEMYVDIDVSGWSCIRHVERRSNYNYGYHRIDEVVTYDDNYDLMVNVVDPSEKDLFNVNVGHISQLTLKNGKLITMPETVYQMTKLKKVFVSGTKISSINFNDFLPMSLLLEIVLAHNMISNIDMAEVDVTLYTQFSNVEAIDLSNNVITKLPNNFVSRFIQLQHLDLSYNMIGSIGLLTFEGIVQLKSLDISHNRLLEVGNALARFTSLQKMSVSNNNLAKILEYNFGSLINLDTLNASYNSINVIENDAFQSLSKLNILDLSYNKITMISKQLLSNNLNLAAVFFTNNEIESIEANIFIDKNINEFSIKNNHLAGAIERNTFRGINVKELDLSGGYISEIKDEAFIDITDLNSLNFSSNAISNISSSAFSSLASLKMLDLSYNKLDELNFNSDKLGNLTKLYAQHNRIVKISKNFFDNLLSLTELDLAYNEIKEIEPKSFFKLTNIQIIKFSHSHFVNTLHSGVFEGLTSLNKIAMSETRTVTYKNCSFMGLPALTHINSPSGQLAEIEYNAFIGTGSIQFLILSYNQLHSFHVNSSTISKIQEIYLNNNVITNISSETFSELHLLRKLYLGNNAIIQLDSNDFKHLKSLMYLDLSSNTRMNIIGNPFQNLSKLYSLSLENIKTNLTFQNSSASIEILDMPSCGITNLNKVYIFNVREVSYLNLSMNEIISIDKDSLGKMISLVSLDLGFNKILNIQPGSFLHIKNLMKLNLFENNLPSIQFGVFDGTEMLKELDLSSNVLLNFDIKVIPSSVIEKIFLDDNIITNLPFEDFLKSEVSVLSVGGNQISCKVLAELKISKLAEKFNKIVTAKNLDYHLQNVNGISCQTSTNNNNFNSATTNETHISDNPSIYINPLVLSIKTALQKLDKTLEVISENTKKTDELRNESKNIANTFEKFIESSNKSQMTSNGHLSKLTNITDEIKLNLMTNINNKNDLKSNDLPSIATTRIIDDQNLRIFRTMLKQETDAIREEFKNTFGNKGTEMPVHDYLVNHNTASTTDTKILFYFIAICLAVMVAAYLGNIVFSHVTKIKRSNNISNSFSPINNSIEME